MTKEDTIHPTSDSPRLLVGYWTEPSQKKETVRTLTRLEICHRDGNSLGKIGSTRVVRVKREPTGTL